jgi:hypothetical protein
MRYAHLGVMSSLNNLSKLIDDILPTHSKDARKIR